MRSDLMKEGVSRAPHRSLLKALGITDSEMKRPFVAVVSSKSDYIPGHTHLDTITKAVEAGIRNAGGVPFTFSTIGVCDGLAMNHKGMKYSLCSRELIADSIGGDAHRPSHGRGGVHPQLRQDSARHADGGLPDESALHFRQRRAHAARPGRQAEGGA